VRHSWIVEFIIAFGMSGLGLATEAPAAYAQVQGLDTPGRARCPGGYVEGLGCSSARSWDSPNIEDSDQGWQRDWSDFAAAAPGLSIFGGWSESNGGGGGGGGGGGWQPPGPPFGPRVRGTFDGQQGGHATPYRARD
jgi:hypothetical protein